MTEPSDLRTALDDALTGAARTRRPHLVDVHVDRATEKPITPWTAAMHEWEDSH